VAATEVSVAVVGTFYVKAGHGTAATAAIQTAIRSYINALAIGGTTLGGSGRVVLSELIVAAMRGHSEKASMLSVTFSTPAADVPLAAGEVATLGTYSMTATEV
jgi:hypothetical protein